MDRQVPPNTQDAEFTLERLAPAAICFPDVAGTDTPSVRVTTPSGRQLSLATTRVNTTTLQCVITPGAGLTLNEFGTYQFTIRTAAFIHAPPTSTFAPTTGSPTPGKPNTVAPTPTGKISPGSGAAAPMSFGASGFAPPKPLPLARRSGRFTVVRAHVPRAIVVGEVHRPGTTNTVLFAGLKPGTFAYPSFYRWVHDGSGPTDHAYALVGDLAEESVNQHGEATVSWGLPRGLSPGKYALWVESQPSLSGPRQSTVVFWVSP